MSENIGDTLRMCHMVSSKICHDLSNPVSGMLTALELLRDSSSKNMTALDLLNLATHQCVSRLGAMRMVYANYQLDVHTSVETVRDYMKHCHSSETDIDSQSLEKLEYQQWNIVMALILHAISHTSRGAKLSLKTEESGAAHIELVGKIYYKPERDEILIGPWTKEKEEEGLSSSFYTHVYYTRMLMSHHGYVVDVDYSKENTLKYTLLKAYNKL